MELTIFLYLFYHTIEYPLLRSLRMKYPCARANTKIISPSIISNTMYLVICKRTFSAIS